MKKIAVGNRKGLEIYTLISDQDLPLVRKYALWLNSNGYVCTRYKGKPVLLHRLIKGRSGLTVDHINHDKLDNRRRNLRVATYSQNQGNRFLNKNNKSGIKGVQVFRNKWKVEIAGRYIGVYGTLKEAEVAYSKASRSYFGKFSYLPPRRTSQKT